MAHFAIMRGEKRKTGDVRGITAHIARSQPTPNADPDKQHKNYAVVGPPWDDPQAINDAIEALTPKKFRKDAVRAIEYIVSASPDWFDDNTDQQAALYFERAVDWFQDEFGTQNVVSAVVHNDESSPHMHILVVPLDADSGRLNGKRFFGNKGVLQKRQSRFAEYMSPFGVERGKPDPDRKHTKTNEWRRGHAQLDEREASLQAREAAAHAAEQRAATEASNAQTVYQLAKKAQSAASHKETELSDRAALLDQRERELSEKVAELSEKVAELTAAAERFEQQKAAWVAENKPTVPLVVRHLRHLERLGVIASAEYLEEQDNDQLYDLFSPQDGVTAAGRALLEKYAVVQERAEQFDQAFTPLSEGPGR